MTWTLFDALRERDAARAELAEQQKRIAKLEEQRDAGWVHPEEVKAELHALQDENDKLRTEVERLRGLLADAPCTCPNPEPHDWPHDPANKDCYKARIDAALRGGEGPK